LTFDIDGDNLIDVWGTDFPPLGWNIDALPLRPFGGRLFKDDESGLAFDEPNTRDAMSWWIGLITEHSVASTAAERMGAAFENGRIAVLFNGSWVLPSYIPSLEFDWDVAAVPAGPAGRFTAAESSGYGITSQSKN